MNKEKALKKNKLFSFVPNKVLKSIAPLFKEHYLERGSIIIDRSEPSQLFFLVTKGKLKTLYHHHHEHEMEAGDYFGEMALLGEKAFVLNAFALQSGTEVLSINKTDFSHCLSAFPSLASVVTNIVADRLCTIGLAGYDRSVGNYSITRKIIWNDREVWFEAEHSYLERALRVQMIPHLFIRDAAYGERLRSKLKMIANLNQSFVVRPLDVVNSLSSIFIVYDREDGIPLSEIIDRVRSIPHPVIIAIVLKTAEMLATLHGLELVHSDIRPENIYCTREGEIRLAHLGILHPDHPVLEFTAPEQMQKKYSGKSADVYALGVLAYFLCSGKYPFEAKEEDLLLKQKLEYRFTDLHEINPALPTALVRFVVRALEPKPEKRFDNLANLRDLFALWLNEDGGKKPDQNRSIENLVASREQIVQWLSKKYFKNDRKDGENAPLSLPRVHRASQEYFSALFESEDDFIEFKLLTFEEFVSAHYLDKAELDVRFQKDDVLTRLHESERERQELAIGFTLLRSLQKCRNRNVLFELLSRLLSVTERNKNYAILSRKEKKIKNQAERVVSGDNYLPEVSSDHKIIEKAESEKKPFLIREKNNFILVCPLYARDRFIGSICVSDRIKKEIDAKMRFYRIVSEIVPVVELES